MRDLSFSAAAIHWRTALARSATGNSHQVSQEGVRGSALHEGTCRACASKIRAISLYGRTPSGPQPHAHALRCLSLTGYGL